MSINIAEQFAIRIRSIRTQLKLSQEDFAEICDVDASYIGRLERMERNPSLETLARMAVGLGVPVHELVNFDKELVLPDKS